jgi:hypothetical protein
MIIEIATAAAMYWVDTAQAAESDIPEMRPQALCQYKDPKRVRQCLDRKFKSDRDVHEDMWDPNWVSSITYRPEDVIKPPPAAPSKSPGKRN